MAIAVRSVSWHCARRRHGDHFGDHALFLQAHRLFDGDLVERVHAHLHVGDVHPGAVALDAHFDVVVDDPFDRDQDLHHWIAKRGLSRATGHSRTRPASRFFMSAIDANKKNDRAFSRL
jgi:hypothetical protein